MDQNGLFSLALGLQAPWKVTQSELTGEADGPKVLHLQIGFERGAKFSCPCGCGEVCGVHDTVPRRWRHLNFWQHETILRADVPRVRCAQESARQVSVPWARDGSGFTLFFEALAMMLTSQMTVRATAGLLEEHDGRIWRIVHHYVDRAHGKQDWSEVKTLGVDETATRKGHKYATVVVDVDPVEGGPARLLFMTPEKKAKSLGEFVAEMPKHQASPEQIKTVAIDMGRAYIKGVAKYLPLAEISFDRFHVMKLAGEAVDQVRKELRDQGADLKGGLWALRGNKENLTAANLACRERLCRDYKEIARALALREMLAQTWEYSFDFTAAEHLREWCSWATRSRLVPFKNLAQTIKEHWDGILGYFPDRITSAAIEAINGIIQTARRRARGYRNFNNLRAISYWMAGRLDLELPTLSNPR
jgi:transposase